MSKKYHIYGLGNALVDQEFEVDDAFFEHESLQKGVMTLVDDESHETLLARLLEDHKLRKRAGGGSAANTIYAASHFGANVYYSCKVADDEPGDFYVRELGDHNIDTNLSDNQEHGTTGQCLVLVSPDAERTMLSYLGISETLSSQDIDPEAIRASEYVYLEGYLVTSDTGREACIDTRKTAEANGVKTAMTFSDPGIVQHFRGGLEDMLGNGVDLLFANKVEALTWTGEDTVKAAAEALKKIAKTFAITLGADGALVWDGSEYFEIAPHKVKAIDSNGAGDMFAGAFLYAVSSGKDFETAGKLASLASATIVSQFGPRLSQDQHQELLRQVTAQEA